MGVVTGMSREKGNSYQDILCDKKCIFNKRKNELRIKKKDQLTGRHPCQVGSKETRTR